jgi:hypothetical protein
MVPWYGLINLQRGGHAQLIGRLDHSQYRGMYSMDPLTEQWLEYWNDDDSDLGNLRTFEFWLSQARRHRG